jgi:hypothetical protein
MTGLPFSLPDQTNVPDGSRVTYFGLTDSRNTRTPFGIKKEDRSRHTYVIGKTGMGKSTLLENMAAQDILNGEGICFIDPHGGSADKLLEYVPEHRIKDVLYFAPFDMEYPISFNVLEKVDADKRHLVVAGLMSTFEKIWVDAWSARMAYILQNTLGALLEFPGATLLSVNRMYIDKEYRKHVIAKITDPSVRSFWVDEYSKYTDRYAQEATPAIQNKIGQFSSNALVRNVIGQPESSFNIRELMDQGKIFIVNLSKGRVGEGNANLLGSMLITKIYLAAMSRADTQHLDMRKLPPFYLYVDEFQNFANKSFADILSEARKYKLALTIAHQYIEQMEDEVRAAVFGNVVTMMTFRVGAYDAEVLEKEFAPVFTVEDLVNLGARQIYLKLMIDGVSSQPFSAVTMPPWPEPAENHADRAIAYSRAQYSHPREEVERNIAKWVEQVYEDPEKNSKEKARLERREIRDKEEKKQPNEFQPRTRLEPRVSQQVSRKQVVATEPRPFPKKPSTGNKEDLRSLLTRVTSVAPSSSVPKEKELKPLPGKSKVISPKVSPVLKKQVPQSNDGKGVTQEDRSELRSLLSTLISNNKHSGDVSSQTVTPHAPSQDVQKKNLVPEEKRATSVNKDEKVSPRLEKKQSQRPKEIPQEKMKEMLHLEKPNL